MIKRFVAELPLKQLLCAAAGGRAMDFGGGAIVNIVPRCFNQTFE
jgi:hypothetical protein